VQHSHTHYTHTCACMAVPKPSNADADASTPSAYSLSGLGYLQSFFRQLADPPQPFSRLQLLQFLSGFLTRDPVLRLGNGPTGDQDIKDVCPTDTHMTLTSWQANRNRVERVHACKTYVNVYNAMRGDRKKYAPTLARDPLHMAFACKRPCLLHPYGFCLQETLLHMAVACKSPCAIWLSPHDLSFAGMLIDWQHPWFADLDWTQLVNKEIKPPFLPNIEVCMVLSLIPCHCVSVASSFSQATINLGTGSEECSLFRSRVH